MKTIKNITTISMGLSMAALLTACGGDGKLSFKNADTVIKSYSKITKDMTELERQTFSRNVALILNDNDTPPEELGLGTWQSAVSQGNELGYLTQDNELVREYASGLALEGVKKLNGKSVSYVNKRGKAIKAKIVDAAAKTTQEKIDVLKAGVKQLDKDKTEHNAAYKAALAEEKKLRKDMAIYKPKVEIESFKKNWNGKQLKLNLKLKNPHEDPIYDVRTNLHIKYKGYFARNRFSGANRYRDATPGNTGQISLNYNIAANSFLNQAGEPLEKGHEFSENAKDYDLELRPIWVRTSSKKNGWKEYEYKLTPAQSNAINQHAKRLVQCDRIIEATEKNIEKNKMRLDTIKTGELDKVQRPSYYGGGNRKIGCAVK